MSGLLLLSELLLVSVKKMTGVAIRMHFEEEIYILLAKADVPSFVRSVPEIQNTLRYFSVPGMMMMPSSIE